MRWPVSIRSNSVVFADECISQMYASCAAPETRVEPETGATLSVGRK